MHNQYRLVSKQHDRMRKKIAAVTEAVGITLENDTQEDLKTIMSESAKFLDELPSGSNRLKQPHRKMVGTCAGIHCWFDGACTFITGK